MSAKWRPVVLVGVVVLEVVVRVVVVVVMVVVVVAWVLALEGLLPLCLALEATWRLWWRKWHRPWRSQWLPCRPSWPRTRLGPTLHPRLLSAGSSLASSWSKQWESISPASITV